MKSILLWCLMLLFISNAQRESYKFDFFIHADTDSVFVAGDSLIGFQSQGNFLQSIRGDVRVVYGSTDVTADQAIRNVTRRTTSFMRNATLIDEGDTLQADSLEYDEKVEVGRAIGNVRLTDGEVVTESPMGIHYVEERRVEFPEGVVLNDSSTTLTSSIGLYHTKNKVAELAGNVRMKSSGIKLEADSLTHYRKRSFSFARGSVRYLTTSEMDSTWITAQQLEYFDKDSLSILRGSPGMMHLTHDTVSTDTLIVRAKLLRMKDKSRASQLEAGGRVRIWNRSFAALADSMVYDRDRDSTHEVIRLYGDPHVWINQSQLTGDTMKVTLKNGSMDSLFVWGNTFVAQEDSLTKRINQVKGHTLISTLQRDSLRTFIIGPNAEAFFFNKDQDGLPDGAIQASGDQIQMEFEGDSLRTLTLSADVEGVRYSESSLPPEPSLEGLKWDLTLKPLKEQLMGRHFFWIQEWEH